MPLVETDRTVAYFSMEIALTPAVPTYSGGLGVLAGDSLRAAADLSIPMVGVSLLHRKGYFYQRLNPDGAQSEEPVEWAIDDYLKPLDARVAVTLEGREVQVGAWVFEVEGVTGYRVPVLLLDTDLPENANGDQTITHRLYAGDARYRLLQEAVLGIGGVRMLRALGFDELQRFHMNEGHASLLALELALEEARSQKKPATDAEVLESVRKKCVFTTHTPVAAGHDQFPMDLVGSVLERQLIEPFRSHEGHRVLCCDNRLNMTLLGFNLSHYVNGVAKRHGEVARQMFGQYPIDAITNGVHATTWVAPPFETLFNQRIPGWREDNFSLRYAMSIPGEEIWKAHLAAKRELIDFVNREANTGLDLDFFTIGFGRRAAAYKRADLIFTDLEQLRRISTDVGRIQLVFAGKAHPHDGPGKDLIRSLFRSIGTLRPTVRAAYLPNYDMELCRLMVGGVDCWLNTPQPPMEASGTSGMKAALNGVPSLSILDGWWLEGCIEGVTGWAIGPPPGTPGDGRDDAESLYQKLSEVVIPLYYHDRPHFIDVMRHAIAVNGSFFHTQRMMRHYVTKAYFV